MNKNSPSIGDSLSRAFDFQLRSEPTEWAYNWFYCEGGTSNPTPRKNHLTLWLVCNNKATIKQHLQEFFQTNVSALGYVTLKFQDKSEEKLVSIYVCRQGRKNACSNGTLLLQGKRVGDEDCKHHSPIPDPSGARIPDPNVGRYVLFEATTKAGCDFALKILECTPWGSSTLIFHDRVVRDIGNNMKLVVTTGLCPDPSALPIGWLGPVPGMKELSTRFELFETNENGTSTTLPSSSSSSSSSMSMPVAKCQVSYRDGSYDPSVGPTIEMIAVRQDCRGRGLLPLLWFWVKKFIEENFILECWNKDDAHPLGHYVMVKASQLSNVEIDKWKGKSLTDKEFFYDHVGFSVRRLLGFVGKMMSARRPMDEEAVLYIPLLTPSQVRARAEQRDFSFIQHDHDDDNNTSGTVTNDMSFLWARKQFQERGCRSCQFCGQIKDFLLRCGRCHDIYYCGKKCQARDWKYHKLWCAKTPDQVHEELVRLGRRTKDKDGNWSTVMGF